MRKVLDDMGHCKRAPWQISTKTAWSATNGCEPILCARSEIRKGIEETTAPIKDFTAQVHARKIRGKGGSFKKHLLIGIDGSALGPQFEANVLGDPRADKPRPFFFDNTDSDGMNRFLAMIDSDLSRKLCIVTAKSAGTKGDQKRNAFYQRCLREVRLGFLFSCGGHLHARERTEQVREREQKVS